MAAKRSTRKPSPRTAKSGRAKSGTAKARPAAKKVAKKVAKKRGKKASKAPAKRRKEPARRKLTAAEAQVEQIQRVIDVMVAAGAVEVELKEANNRLRVRLKEEPPNVAVSAVAPLAAAPHPVAFERVANPDASGSAAPEATAPEGEVFKSPMVGTFYRASSPDAEPFVKEGDQVTEDSVLCIIEAMKVMNEIGAEMTGQVVAILAQNGEPVDYGQPLFVVKT